MKNSTNGKAKLLTDQYLDNLIQAKWIGLEQGQYLVRKSEWFYKHVGMRIRNKIIPRLSPEFCWKYEPYPLAEMEFSICPERFIEYTHEYVNNILKTIGLDINKNIVLNQPFPGNNPVPYMKYFPNSKAIVVDRDPRDVFVFLKNVFPGHSYSVPLENVEVFCEYFANMHKNICHTLNHPDVLYLHFEDLVYHYQESTDKIKKFLSLEKSTFPQKYFIPLESEANTQVFLEHGNQEEIAIIEKKLNKYLYDFTVVTKQKELSKAFDDNPHSISYSFKRN